MAYIVNKTDGNIVAVVDDGTVNTAVSLGLVGKGYASYGEVMAENSVALLENFANSVPPRNPLAGQIWYNKQQLQMQVYDGDKFLPIQSVQVSASMPAGPRTGEFWYHSDKKQLFYYRETEWQLIGPLYANSQGRSEIAVESFTDSAGIQHVVTCVYANGKRIIAISGDAYYVTSPLVQGFEKIYPGINLATGSILLNDAVINGTSVKSLTSQGLEPAADATYMHTNSNSVTTGTVTVANQGGVTIGVDNDLSLTVSANTAAIALATHKQLSIRGHGATEIVFDQLSNNIGIGKRNPSSLLDVAGPINADGPIKASSFYLGTNSSMTSIAGSVRINANGITSLIADVDGTLIVPTSAVFNAGITVTQDSTFNNFINLPTLPQSAGHVANKAYVDQTILTAALPRGSIIMWYGTESELPISWKVCDGRFGTPDLRDKFIMGAGQSAVLGQTGGANFLDINTNVAGSHVHSATTAIGGTHDHGSTTQPHALTIQQLPSHTHTLDNVISIKAAGGRALHESFETNSVKLTETGSTGENQTHRHGIQIDNGHVHSLTTDSRGEHDHRFSYDNRPNWLALYYIMKVA